MNQNRDIYRDVKIIKCQWFYNILTKPIYQGQGGILWGLWGYSSNSDVYKMQIENICFGGWNTLLSI